MLTSSALAALCLLLQDAPTVPLPTSGPIAVEVGTGVASPTADTRPSGEDEPATGSEGTIAREQLQEVTDAVPAPSDSVPLTLIRPLTDDDTFRQSLIEQIRKENPEISEVEIERMVSTILEMRERLSRNSPLGPVLNVPRRDDEGPHGPDYSGPDYSGPAQSDPFGMPQGNPHPGNPHPMGQGPFGAEHGIGPGHPGMQGPGFQGPGMMPGMSSPNMMGPGVFNSGMPGPGMMPGQAMHFDNPDQFYIHALRSAAKQLDDAAANLEERGAFDLADQMREQAMQLRRDARERAHALRGENRSPEGNQPSDRRIERERRRDDSDSNGSEGNRFESDDR